jgi:hypothetical protein
LFAHIGKACAVAIGYRKYNDSVISFGGSPAKYVRELFVLWVDCATQRPIHQTAVPFTSPLRGRKVGHA